MLDTHDISTAARAAADTFMAHNGTKPLMDCVVGMVDFIFVVNEWETSAMLPDVLKVNKKAQWIVNREWGTDLAHWVPFIPTV